MLHRPGGKLRIFFLALDSIACPVPLDFQDMTRSETSASTQNAFCPADKGLLASAQWKQVADNEPGTSIAAFGKTSVSRPAVRSARTMARTDKRARRRQMPECTGDHNATAAFDGDFSTVRQEGPNDKKRRT
jgi:hypothetical protein